MLKPVFYAAIGFVMLATGAPSLAKKPDESSARQDQNRGTADIAADSGIACWTFPGGSPQYPDSDPVANTNNGSLVDTFDETIKAGDCITHYLPASAFGANGTQSVMCNVRQRVTSIYDVPSATGYNYGAYAFDWPGTPAWTNTGNLDSAATTASTTCMASVVISSRSLAGVTGR